jgi:hypothetical protein
MNKIAALLLTICFMATGCPPERIEGTRSQEYSGYVLQGTVYFQDPRTNLCFLAFGSTRTNVPCTPEVLAEINKVEVSR